MSKPYRPSNGIEGECFMETFCFRCARDAKYRQSQDGNDGCPIIAAALIYELSDPKYPPEWVSDESGPRCTAFTLDSEPDEIDRFYARRDPREADLPL